jgi:hypothetical protein
VDKAVGYKPEGRGFDEVKLGPGVYSASNRNEETQKNNVFGESIAAGAWGWQPYRHL